MVRSANWLLSPFDEPDDDLFDSQRYIQANLDGGPRCAAIIDSNIFYRIVRLARGHRVKNEVEAKENYRLIAAHMAFFQLCNILIEPNMPLYEGCHSKKDDELKLFRKADNLPVKAYIDIALGRADTIAADLLESPGESLDPEEEAFTNRLNEWEFNLIFAAKIAQLELTSNSHEAKMEMFLDWMFQEFQFCSVATIFAVLYLSPKRKLPLLEKLRSGQMDMRWSGLKNAVWDLTIIDNWLQHANDQHKDGKYWLLASRDRPLLRVANLLRGYEDITDDQIEERIRALFVEHWGSKSGLQLAQKYFQLTQRLNESARNQNRPTTPEKWKPLLESLLGELLQGWDWKSGSPE